MTAFTVSSYCLCSIIFLFVCYGRACQTSEAVFVKAMQFLNPLVSLHKTFELKIVYETKGFIFEVFIEFYHGEEFDF